MRKRRGIGHIIAFIIILIVVVIVIFAVTSYYNQIQLRNTSISGDFQGSTTVNTGSGDQYIVRISNATITCDSWTMTTADIYTLTHLQAGQTVTMSLACSNIVVG
jgi:hypothetical protein